MNTTHRGLLAAAAALAVGAGCGSEPGTENTVGPTPGEPPAACAPDGDGLACLFELHADAVQRCAPDAVLALEQSLDAREGALPAWHDGRALFVSRGGPVDVAGEFNGYTQGALVTRQVCSSQIHTAELALPSGRYQYKVIRGGVWQLDPENWAFAYDSFPGNPEGRNSVINTHDSGLGHLVSPPDLLCSEALGNCRPLTTYLPAGYAAPESAGRAYPVIFMHDGQNIFDDEDCCFGHTGWEVNVTLDDEIRAGRVEPMVIVGFDHAGGGRIDEYGISTEVGGVQEVFMAFQVEQVQPAAAGYWRLDADRVYTAGSSLGGLISFRLAFAYPDVYAGAASLSGSFFVGEEDGTSMRDFAQAAGKLPLSLYMDHGGTVQDGADNLGSNVELRDFLVSLGWQRRDFQFGCESGPDGLCYFHEVGAQHNELEWGARSFQFLRYFFGR